MRTVAVARRDDRVSRPALGDELRIRQRFGDLIFATSSAGPGFSGPSKVTTSCLLPGGPVMAVTTGPLPSAKESSNRLSSCSNWGRYFALLPRLFLEWNRDKDTSCLRMSNHDDWVQAVFECVRLTACTLHDRPRGAEFRPNALSRFFKQEQLRISRNCEGTRPGARLLAVI